MSAPSSDDAPRRGSLRAVPYSQLPPRATLPPRKGKTKGLTKGQGKSKDKRPGSATTQRTSAPTAVPRELHGQQVNITPAGIPTQMLSNEKIPSEPRLLVLARHRAQQHKPKSADSQFRRQARRPSKWQGEGQPNKIFRRMGPSGLTVPQPALQRRKGRWMASPLSQSAEIWESGAASLPLFPSKVPAARLHDCVSSFTCPSLPDPRPHPPPPASYIPSDSCVPALRRHRRRLWTTLNLLWLSYYLRRH